jgi:tetratricopeptide (TPR) repeat protein
MAFKSAPWELIPAGRYEEALSGLNELRRTGVDYDWRTAGERGTALLCLRKYEDAISAYDEANRMARGEERQRLRRIGKDSSNGLAEPFLIDLGASQWLADRKGAAVETWQRAVSGVLDGTIFMGDMAGAVTQGLLLWFAGISMGRPDIAKEATKYLANRARRSRIKLWPGPLALLVMERVTASSVLTEKFGSDDLDRLSDRAAGDLLTRREFSQFLFYCAMAHRAKGDATHCKELLGRCVRLKNPIIEIEWYLARGELEQA